MTISFESEQLVVDYLSLNIGQCQNTKSIAVYLFKTFGFNCVSQDSFKGPAENMKFKKTNNYKVCFVNSVYNPESGTYWAGTTLKFSGKNATYFYSLIRKNLIDWDILDLASTNIGRFDLYYFRKFNQKEAFPELFFEDSCIKATTNCNIPAVWQRTTKGLIMKIGKRRNPTYLRVYEGTREVDHVVYSQLETGLKFEFEFKKQLIKAPQTLLFQNKIEEFETKLIEYFFKYSKRYLFLNSGYADWLCSSLRKIASQKESNFYSNYLVTSYLTRADLVDFSEKERFFLLLQFLCFLRNVNYDQQFIDDQAYYVVTFPLFQFTEFRGGNGRSTYQRKKTVRFLTSLLDLKPLFQRFSEQEFRRSVIFPHLKIRKEKKTLLVTIAVKQEFYEYLYPFLFPKSFLLVKSKYDLQLKLLFLESVSTVHLEKKIFINQFFSTFAISNKDLSKIRNQLIELFILLKSVELIEDRLVILFLTKEVRNETIGNLTPAIISKTESISFWEKI